MNFTIYITDQYFHHHAESIVESNKILAEQLTSALNSNVVFDYVERTKNKKKVKGIEAEKLNEVIRILLSDKLPEIETEVFEVDGVYYSGKAKKGFDFAFIDKKQNLLKLRNLCFGSRPYRNGHSIWNDYISKNSKVSELAAEYDIVDTSDDLPHQREKPIILGEIQFGNWGLVYRDFFKVLNANIFTDVDLLIYVVADGKLEKLLSDGIVGFSKTKQFLLDNSKVVTIPTWVIALDIEELPNS